MRYLYMVNPAYLRLALVALALASALAGMDAGLVFAGDDAGDQ